MNLRRFITLVILVLGVGEAVLSQSAINDSKPVVKFRARLLSDCTVSSLGSETPNAYYKVEDFRIGLKATHGNYSFASDFGISGQQVSIKDLFLKYTKDDRSIWTLGNTYEPFSMEILTSTKDMYFHQSAASVLAITNGRRFGVTHILNTERSHWAAGVFSDNDVNKWHTEIKQAYAVTSRYIYHTPEGANTLLHVGGAASFRTIDNNKSSSFYRTVTHSTVGVSSMLGETLLSNEITDSKYHIKSGLELLVMTNKFRVQSEWLSSNVMLHSNTQSHLTYGGYVQASYLLFGKGFSYDREMALVSAPRMPAVELTMRYNTLNMAKYESLPQSTASDISVGVNYYISKYAAIKLNGSYVYNTENANTFYGDNYYLTQFRLQIYI